MDILLIIILIVFLGGVLLSGQRPSVQPQIIYVQLEPEQSGELGCLVPLIFVALVLFILFVIL